MPLRIVIIDYEVYFTLLPRLKRRPRLIISRCRYKGLLENIYNSLWCENSRGLALEDEFSAVVQFKISVKKKELRVIEEMFAINREK